jgi:two-component system, NarL family, nitrate/nitrite response regulator NarL
MTRSVHQASSNNLTPREQQIHALICQGLSNKQIARQLRISEGTVKHHVHTILSKTRLRRRRELRLAG